MKSGCQQPFTESSEAKTFDRTVNNHRGSRSVKSDRMDKGAGFPAAGGDGFDKSVAAKRPSPKPREVGLHPCLINEYKSLGVYTRLARKPDLSLHGNIFAVLFRRPLRLFLKRAFRRFTAHQTVFTEQSRLRASRRS